MTATDAHDLETAATPGGGAPAPPVRWSLVEGGRSNGRTLDGAWWPRSRSLADELPALIADLHRHGIRITRVAYRPESWEPAPRRLPADDRIIRLGSFQGLDPHLVRMTGGDGGQTRLDLLVLPADLDEAVAGRATEAATAPQNHVGATALLAAVGALPGDAQGPSTRSEPWRR